MRFSIVKVLWIIALGVCLNACTMTVPALSKESYENANSFIKENLAYQDFQLVGTSNETRNDMSVSGVSYSKVAGYGTAMANNYWHYQSFNFTDSIKETVSYTVKYQLLTDQNGIQYVNNIEVAGCSATRDYDKICSDTGVVKTIIKAAKNHPDSQVTLNDKKATTIGTVSVSVFLGIILTVILCSVL